MTVLLFIAILAILILAHEFGHFSVAKASGIRVDEFGIGFPPKLWGKKKGETEYTINAIPFGGFVKIFGENPDEESTEGEDSVRSIVNKPRYIQAAVLVAGVFFNLLLAWFLLSWGLMIGLPTSATSPLPAGEWVGSPSLTITEVLPNAPADRAGLQPGDKIISAASPSGNLDSATLETFQPFVQLHGKEKLSLSVLRGETQQTITITPKLGVYGEKPAIGVALDMVGTMKLSPVKAIQEGASLTYLYTGETLRGLYDLFASAFRGQGSMASVSGPVGIVGIVGDASRLGFVYILSLTALISINLAVINIMPIPALDGGRLFFLLIEAIRRKPLKSEIVNKINATGFAVLLILIMLVTFHDIWKIFFPA